MQIFNNWDVIAKGWYIACSSQEIPKKKAKSLELCGQRIVIFRGAFHHWTFDESGLCQHIPSQSEIPAQARVPAYATEEKYGFIWIYPDAEAPEEVPNFDELKDKEILTQTDRSFTRTCHHHICMMNGIDIQHLKTIHHLDIKMELSLNFPGEIGTQIDFTIRGQFPQTTWRERLGQRFLGATYQYSMRYAYGCIGLLKMMKNVQFSPPPIYALCLYPHSTCQDKNSADLYNRKTPRY